MPRRSARPVESFPRTESVIARDPGDLTRLLWSLVVTAIGVLAARGAEQTTAGLEGDLVELVGHLPDVVVGFVLIGVQVLYVLLLLGIPLALLVTRRFRRWGIYTLGWILTGILVSLAERLVPGEDVAALPDVGLSTEQYGSWPPSQSVATGYWGPIPVGGMSMRWLVAHDLL